MLRYGSETNFARVTSENILRDTIPSSHFQVLDHANHWAHASANDLATPALLNALA
jgi:hypothetical protein